MCRSATQLLICSFVEQKVHFLLNHVAGHFVNACACGQALGDAAPKIQVHIALFLGHLSLSESAGNTQTCFVRFGFVHMRGQCSCLVIGNHRLFEFRMC